MGFIFESVAFKKENTYVVKDLKKYLIASKNQGQMLKLGLFVRFDTDPNHGRSQTEHQMRSTFRYHHLLIVFFFYFLKDVS